MGDTGGQPTQPPTTQTAAKEEILKQL